MYVSFSAAECSRWILTTVCVCVCLSVLYHIWVHSSHGVCVTALCMWRVLCVRVKCICSSFMVVSVDFCYPALLRQCLALTWWNMSAPWGIPSVCWVAVKQLCTCAFMHFSDSVLQKRARQIHYKMKWNFSPPEVDFIEISFHWWNGTGHHCVPFNEHPLNISKTNMIHNLHIIHDAKCCMLC